MSEPALTGTRAGLRALLVGIVLLLPILPARAAEVVVFAAASLKPALDAIIATPQALAIGEIKLSYAASSQLARQIEHDAPAALFISADVEWMDFVEQRGKLIAGTRSDLLGNALVLVAASDSTTRLTITPGFDLVGALGADGRLAIGEPNSVPVEGRQGMARNPETAFANARPVDSHAPSDPHYCCHRHPRPVGNSGFCPRRPANPVPLLF